MKGRHGSPATTAIHPLRAPRTHSAAAGTSFQ